MSQRRANVIVELPKLLYIIEVKVNKKPEEDLEQIETQEYYQPFLHLKKPVKAITEKRQQQKKQVPSLLPISLKNSKVISLPAKA